MKDTFYFTHDYNARSDVKIKKLLAKHGLEGYGLYWAIVEDLYNNANALPLDCESIAFDMRTNDNLVNSVIHDFGLFVIEDKEFGSLSVQRRLDERALKSKKARDSANKRWLNNANALQTQSDGNAIKERKGKEKKEIKEYLGEAKPKHSLIVWLDKFCPTIQKMKEPITEEQAIKIKEDFKNKSELVANTFLAMENKPDLHKKYKSANLTFRNWAKNDFGNSSNSTKDNPLLEKWKTPADIFMCMDWIKRIPKPPDYETQTSEYEMFMYKWRISELMTYQYDRAGAHSNLSEYED